MGGQRRQEIQQKRARRAQRRATRKQGAGATQDEENDDKQKQTNSVDHKNNSEQRSASVKARDSQEADKKEGDDVVIEREALEAKKAGQDRQQEKEQGISQKLKSDNVGGNIESLAKSSRLVSEECTSGNAKLEKGNMKNSEEVVNVSPLESSTSPSPTSTSTRKASTITTCYAPTCPSKDLRIIGSDGERKSIVNKICFSPSCDFFPSAEPTASVTNEAKEEGICHFSKKGVSEMELEVAKCREELLRSASAFVDLEALTSLSLELEKTSDQMNQREPIRKSKNSATQKKSFSRRSDHEDNSRSMLQELQDIVCEESKAKVSQDIKLDDPQSCKESRDTDSIGEDSNNDEDYKKRTDTCVSELQEFKKTFEMIHFDILSLDTRVLKLEEKKLKVQQLKKEEQLKMEEHTQRLEKKGPQKEGEELKNEGEPHKDTKKENIKMEEDSVFLLQPPAVKPPALDGESDFEEFAQDKEEEWQGKRKTKDCQKGGNKISLEENKQWREDWEDDFEEDELASILLAVK